MSVRSFARVALVLVSAAVLQRGLFAQLRIEGAAFDVFLLLAVAGGLASGPDRGAILGFFSGLVLDLLVQTPMGLSALTYCVVGYVSGRLQDTVRRANRLLPSLLAALAGASGVVGYAVLAAVLGQASAVSDDLVAVALVVAVGNAILIRPAIRLVQWAWPVDTAIVPTLR